MGDDRHLLLLLPRNGVVFMNRLSVVLGSVVIAVLVIGTAAYYRYTHPLVATSRPATPATNSSASRTTTTHAHTKPAPGPTTQLLDILRLKNPRYPTTQRLDTALDLRYAARLVLDDPAYLDDQGNLWITRPDAPEPFNFLKASASNTATHVTRDRVVFVYWSQTENGLWLPNLVVRAPGGKGGYQLVNHDGRRPLPDSFGFRWDRALVLGGANRAKDRIVVPTASGACAFAFDASPEEIARGHQKLVDPATTPDSAVQLVMDTRGVIAYVTNAAGNKGGRGVARYAPVPQPVQATQSADSNAASPAPPAYKWTLLTGTDGWPDNLLHLVPLLDGSVLQIVSAPPGEDKEKDHVTFSVNSVAPADIDRAKVLKLIDQLSSADQEKRDEAFKTLTTYGPGIAPILEQQLEDQQPEAQIRIRQLLKNRIEPSLGSMTLVDGRMRVVNRLPDGGVIFYAEAGVAIPRDEDTPAYVSPAWLSVRPGRAAELLPSPLTAELNPDKQTIVSWGYSDHIVQDPVMGPEWFIGNRLEPLLRKPHRRFSQFAGIDATGRWIFREPRTSPDSIATTAPATTATTTTPSSSGPTTSQATSLARRESVLIIDPHLPDPTPRLPGWLLPPSVGKSGWDQKNWPVIYMDVKPDPIPWALTESEWHVINKGEEKVFTDPADIPAAPAATAPATSQAATAPLASTNPTTGPATTQAAAPDFGPPLLTLPDGTRYYDGRQSLKVVRPNGSILDWPLPQQAVGTGKPTLLRTRDGLLFLFNEPGRVVRIRETPDAESPLEFEAVFTRGIPSDADVARIWLDPADRICIAHGGNRITVLFPIGRIPPAIAEKMRPEDFPPDDDAAADTNPPAQ
jgi:hypothetical protein